MLGKTFGFVCHLVTLEAILLEMNCIAKFEHVPQKPGKKKLAWMTVDYQKCRGVAWEKARNMPCVQL